MALKLLKVEYLFPLNSSPSFSKGPLGIMSTNPSGVLGVEKSEASLISPIPTPQLKNILGLLSLGTSSFH